MCRFVGFEAVVLGKSDDVVEVPAGWGGKASHERAVLHQSRPGCSTDNELVVIESIDLEERIVTARTNVYLRRVGSEKGCGRGILNKYQSGYGLSPVEAQQRAGRRTRNRCPGG